MKREFLVLIFLPACLFHSSAQTTFQKAIGGAIFDSGHSIHQTTDGGYIIAGQTTSHGAGSYDVYLIKTNAHGDTLWTKTYGSTGVDFGNSVQQTTDGGYIITGSTDGFGAGDFDIYLIKTDDIGNLIWTKTFGGVNYDYGSCGRQTSDGGYIITGYTNSFGSGDMDVYLIKSDANGDTLWTITFGGNDGDYSNSVQQTTDGGYILTGETSSFGTGDDDIFLIKTDSAGNSLWTKTYGGSDQEFGSYCLQTFDGGYVVAGVTYSFGAGFYDIYLLKTDASGSTLWAKTFGGSNGDYGTHVQQTSDSGYILAGYTNSFGGAFNAYLNKTDVNGILTWSKTFGGTLDDFGNSVQQTANGEYVMAGRTKSFGVGTANVYLIKTDTNGNSGCNETNPVTITANHIAQGISVATMVSSGATITSPFTAVGGGGLVSTLCTTVGINNSSTSPNVVSIYPNPATNHLTISLGSNDKEIQVTITDITGKRIYITTVSDPVSNRDERIEVNTKDFAEGVYFVRIHTTDFSKTEKLIIVKKI